MNCFKNLNRLEFVITWACSGRCKHCSEGEHKRDGKSIDEKKAVEFIKTVARKYKIESIMTFGGEPLLHPNAVCAIHATAREMKIPKRQLITNGFFSKAEEKIKRVANDLAACGVNDVLVSADVLHQEAIPLEPVMFFAKELHHLRIKTRVQPAWLVNKENDNSYNRKTKEILELFRKEGIDENEGNIILPHGNAKKYLSEYFDLSKEYVSPYAVDPYDIDSISVNPDGKVLNGNIYERNILDIMEDYCRSLN